MKSQKRTQEHELVFGLIKPKTFAFSLFFIWFAFLEVAIFCFGWSHNSDGSLISKLGTLGDSFGVVNSILSSLSVLAAVFAIIQQNKASADVEEQAKEQREHEIKQSGLIALIQSSSTLVTVSNNNTRMAQAKWLDSITTNYPPEVRENYRILYLMEDEHFKMQLKILYKYTDKYRKMIGDTEEVNEIIREHKENIDKLKRTIRVS